mmetsp:Transcript_8400/g.12793  ORF Transcript_8400/g.12793 Transcript_8400/m.12793 type:complete len:334 (+) Transcript_8400:495-1496(+)
MSDIIVGHCQDGHLGDRTHLALHTTGSLVDSRQVGVHVTWVTSSSRHLFSSSRNFSQGVGVGGHIGQDGHHMHLFLVGQMLGGGEGETGSDNTLDGGVVGVVHEQHDTVHGAVHLEVGLEETGSLQVDSHSGEHNSEVLIRVIQDVLALDERGLSANLSSDFVMGETGSGEEGDLLSSGDGSHGIDGGDTSLDHLLGVDPLVGVDGLTLDVEELLSQHGRALIDGVSGPVEHATQHLHTHRHSQHIACELAGGAQVIDVRGSLEDLDDGLLALDLKNLALTDGAVAKAHVDDLGVFGELHVVEHHEGAFDVEDGSVVNSGGDVVVFGDCFNVF